MSGFFSDMFDEMVARRRRRKDILGDWGQGAAGFLVMAGLGFGSIGLLARPWMAATAPWGFAVPLVFALGYAAIDWRRQGVVARAGDDIDRQEEIANGYDWLTLLWGLACALAGAAAFVIAWTNEPPPWAPPETAIDFTIETTP